MFHDVLRHPKFGSYDLSSLSRVGYAGMTMTPALIERCLEQLKPELFVNYYGSSEIYTFTYCDHLDRKPGCAGRAGHESDHPRRVAGPRATTSRSTCRPASSGEIVASMNSPEAFTGYWKRPDADAKAIHGRWYRTGDLGKFDEDGELYVVGRVDDMIISGGENIFPEEVEDTLARSRLVAGCAVVGMPDERLGAQGRRVRRAGAAGSHAGAARRGVPEQRPRPLQAAEGIRLREIHPALRVRQAAAPQAADRRI